MLKTAKSALIVLTGLGLTLSLLAPVFAEEAPPVSGNGNQAAIGASISPSAPLALPPGTLRNIDFLPRLQTSRPPARPRKFLRRRNLKVVAERDAKYVQLLLVSVGFVSMFIVILALRSMPPAKKPV